MAVLLGGAAAPVQANPFTPVITVNDRVITQYELDQRILFMQILRQPGDIEKQARQGLIEDRLRMQAAEQLGLKATPDQILGGMNEFAGRANMTAEQFIEAVGGMGVQAETFRDFVEAGLLWREVVRAKYAGLVTITDAEVDRALANFIPTTAQKFQLSEIVLQADGANRSAAMTLARRLMGQIKTEADFVAAARSTSAGASAGNGGRLGWKRISDLPDGADKVLRGAAVGQVAQPLVTEDKVILYWLSEIGEDKLGASAGIFVDYAQFLVPNDANAEAVLAATRAKVDTCNDLYTVAKGLPAERLLREKQPQGEIPGDIAAALTALDVGESSTALTRGGWRVFLMLCSRGASEDLMPDRENARTQLLNQRLAGKADLMMEEMRSEAIIVEK
jgi:peptidyl-prolyl cis-trans isomerase SurA